MFESFEMSFWNNWGLGCRNIKVKCFDLALDDLKVRLRYALFFRILPVARCS